MAEYIRRFDSLSAFAAQACKAPKDKRSQSWSDSRQCVTWSGGTHAEAHDMASHGWGAGATQAHELARKLVLPDIRDDAEAIVKMHHDVSGAYVDVGTYVTGAPECMVDFEADKRQARFARLVVNVCYHGGTYTEHVIARGVAITAAIDAIEARGIRCDVDVVMTVRGRDSALWTAGVNVKLAHEPLQLERVVFAVAHPCMLRRLCFGVMECENEKIRKVFGFHNQDGYGIPVDCRSKYEDAIYFSGTPGAEWLDTDYAMQRVRETVEAAVNGKGGAE